jgi:hypothetical protein
LATSAPSRWAIASPATSSTGSRFGPTIRRVRFLWGKEIRFRPGRPCWWSGAGGFRLRVLLRCLLYRLLCWLVGVLARGGGERELEIVVLRHQLAILRRGRKRPQYTTADQALLAALSRLLPPERWSCFAVSPQTLRRWHRATAWGRSATPPSRARPSAARGRDARPDQAAGAGEPSLGLRAYPGRTAEARDQRLGHHDRDRVSKLGARAGAATDRPHPGRSSCAPKRTACSAAVRAPWRTTTSGTMRPTRAGHPRLGRTARWKPATASPRRMPSSHLQLLIPCGADRRPRGRTVSPRPEGRCGCRLRIGRMPRDGPQRAGPRSSHSQVLRRDIKPIPSRLTFAANRASNPPGRLRGDSAPRRPRNSSATGPSCTPEPSFFTPQVRKLGHPGKCTISVARARISHPTPPVRRNALTKRQRKREALTETPVSL